MVNKIHNLNNQSEKSFHVEKHAQTGELMILCICLFIGIVYTQDTQSLYHGNHMELDTNEIHESNRQDSKPYFVESLSNQTVPVGRDAIFQCVVKNLNNHKVSLTK